MLHTLGESGEEMEGHGPIVLLCAKGPVPSVCRGDWKWEEQ